MILLFARLLALLLATMLATSCSPAEPPSVDSTSKSPAPTAASASPSSSSDTTVAAYDSTIAWGREADGLQAGIAVQGRQFEVGAEIVCMLHFKNVSKRPLRIVCHPVALTNEVQFGRVRSIADGRVWIPVWSTHGNYAVDTPLRVFQLAPGEEADAGSFLVEGRRGSVMLALNNPEVPESDREHLIDLPPGRYFVSADWSLPAGDAGNWSGRVVTGEIGIEITAERRARE